MSKASISSDDGSCIFLSNPRMRMQRLRKSVYNAGLDISERLGASHIPWMFTLTYRRVDDWRANHLKDYMQRIRVYMKRRGMDLHYVWVAELQKRGAVHYHIIIWLKRGFKLPFSDKQGWWSHGFTEQKPARKGVGYLMKYTSKGSHGFGPKFPKGIRIYGYSRHFLSTVYRVSFYRAPRWVRAHFPSAIPGNIFCYLVRNIGGWVNKLTGEFFETPIKFKFFKYDRSLNGCFLVREDLSRPIDNIISFTPTVQEFISNEI